MIGAPLSPLPHCWVCNQRFVETGGDQKRHEHHIIPQAYGGRNGPLVSLCTNHHNLLHELADKMIWNKKGEAATLVNSVDAPFRERLLYLATRVLLAYNLTKEDPNKKGKVVIGLSGAQLCKAKLLANSLGVSLPNLFVHLLNKESI